MTAEAKLSDPVVARTRKSLPFEANVLPNARLPPAVIDPPVAVTAPSDRLPGVVTVTIPRDRRMVEVLEVIPCVAVNDTLLASRMPALLAKVMPLPLTVTAPPADTDPLSARAPPVASVSPLVTLTLPTEMPTGASTSSEPPLKLDTFTEVPPFAAAPERSVAAPMPTNIVPGSRFSAPEALISSVPVLRNIAREVPVIDRPSMVTASCAATMSANDKAPPRMVKVDATSGRIVSRCSNTAPPMLIRPVSARDDAGRAAIDAAGDRDVDAVGDQVGRTGLAGDDDVTVRRQHLHRAQPGRPDRDAGLALERERRFRTAIAEDRALDGDEAASPIGSARRPRSATPG